MPLNGCRHALAHIPNNQCSQGMTWHSGKSVHGASITCSCWVLCRYAWAAISEWQCHQGISQGGRLSQSPAQGPTPRHAIRRTRSVACMTQLQAKQKYGYDASPADSDSLNSPERYGALHSIIHPALHGC